MSLGDFDDRAKEDLSALADGETDTAKSADACLAWASDARLQADWHAWHLIGDVLRSEDLAADPSADRRLCAAIRVRLQSEAVVLAPMAAEARSRQLAGGEIDDERRVVRRRSGRGWATGGAVAAGVVLVAGTFALLRTDDVAGPAGLASTGAAAVPVASADPSPVTSPVTAARTARGEAAAPPVALVTDGKLIRDARLDRYLEAHKQFAGTSALGVPSAFLRSATLDSTAR